MFGGLNKKTVLQVLVIFLVLKVLSEGTSGILILLFTLPGVLLAITFHEWAHAFVAVKLGDETPKEQGRVTLNPIKHIDPFGFIFLILAGFGWGKPVEIDSRNFNGKYSISKAEAIVAIAGPIANFILAFILLLTRKSTRLGESGLYSSSLGYISSKPTMANETQLFPLTCESVSAIIFKNSFESFLIPRAFMSAKVNIPYLQIDTASLYDVL